MVCVCVCTHNFFRIWVEQIDSVITQPQTSYQIILFLKFQQQQIFDFQS